MIVDLFTRQRRAYREGVEPLAVRMRPRTLDEFVGQERFIGKGRLLRRTLEADRITSALFYGPAGVGKTTLAMIIAHATKAHFEMVNASSAGVKEVRLILNIARERLESSGQRTILFVDELHRFNRSQQDVLLGDVENGIVILIGATTENPFYVINAPLISRSQLFQFEPLSVPDIKRILSCAIADHERGLGEYRVCLTDEAGHHLAVASDGDARRALTALEIAVLSQARGSGGGPHKPIRVDLQTAIDSIQRKALQHDRAGDAHYDTISAMIKSIRGSDPDAAVYWLARMLEAGEDPRFLARRIVISAAEDIGNADPQALVLAQAAADATHLIGMPECQLPLAQVTTYLACAPKSNAAARAIWSATDDVRQGRTIPVPRELRSSASTDRRDPGSPGDEHPQSQSDHNRVSPVYYGVDKVYYIPTEQGTEARLRESLERIRKKRGADQEHET